MDISKYVKVGENGELQIDKEAFQSDFDRETRSSIDKATQNSSAKLREQIKKELEDEAKLTAEEKLKADRDAFELEKAEAYKQLGRAKAEGLLEGFSKEEKDVLLELVVDNKEETLAKIEKIAKARKAAIDAEKQKYQETLLGQQPAPKDGNSTPESEGAKAAKNYQQKQNGEGSVTAFNNLI